MPSSSHEVHRAALDQAHERLGRVPDRVPELGPLGPVEQRAEVAAGHDMDGGARAPTGRDDRRQPRHPVDRLVADVPDRGEDPAGAQDASDLGAGFVVVEPVERLRRDDRVGRAGRQRDLLGRALYGGHAGARGDETPEHGCVVVDRSDCVAERGDGAAEDPGAGAEINDLQRRLAEHPADRLFRVGGPGVVVEICRRPERAGEALERHLGHVARRASRGRAGRRRSRRRGRRSAASHRPSRAPCRACSSPCSRRSRRRRSARAPPRRAAPA